VGKLRLSEADKKGVGGFKLTLLGRTLHNLALNSVSTDQPEDENGFRLPDTMWPILGLQVHLQILH